jgi:hypothetical protein
VGEVRIVMLRSYLQTIYLRRRTRDLERALGGYPLYDPPHKIEERLLTKEKATENFDYFMGVRLARVAYLQDWLQRHFGVTATLDEKGVRALSRWGNEYAGFLLVKRANGRPTLCYFTYDPPWTGENAGHNVLFDMGTTLGEAIIANCPMVHWDLDPVSAILPHTAKILRREPGMGFQRPMLTGFDNPAYTPHPLQYVSDFAHDMAHNMTTVEGINRFHRFLRRDKQSICDQLINTFNQILKAYPEGDPANLRKEMGLEDYLKIVDSESEE